MHTIIQFYSPADVDDRVDREGEKKIKHSNMHTIIQFYQGRIEKEGMQPSITL